MEIKKLSECCLIDVVKAWNDGFEGYYFDATTTVEKFISRLVLEGLSPTLSLVAFKDEQPIGIVLNGIRHVQGQKIAWNGGTGIAAAFRKQGIGKALMDATMNVYREEGVDIATLEAISDNKKAISLYEKVGYQKVDQLEYLELKGAVNSDIEVSNGSYIVKMVPLPSLGNIDFYSKESPWQIQWQSAKESEAIMVMDDKNVVGYAFYRKIFDENGEHVKTILYQCSPDPVREDANKIVKFMLNYVFKNFTENITRVIPNMPVNKSWRTYQILKDFGFQTSVEQVFMIKQL